MNSNNILGIIGVIVTVVLAIGAILLFMERFITKIREQDALSYEKTVKAINDSAEATKAENPMLVENAFKVIDGLFDRLSVNLQNAVIAGLEKGVEYTKMTTTPEDDELVGNLLSTVREFVENDEPVTPVTAEANTPETGSTPDDGLITGTMPHAPPD